VAGVNGDLIEDYLARLRAGLPTPPARTAEIVAEAEDHLRESVAAGRAAGLDEAAAERAAVAAFGPVKQVARAHRPGLAAYAAAAGLRAWPLFGWYLVLSALLGGIVIGRETAVFHRGIITPVTWHGTTVLGTGRPDAVQLAATLGGWAIAGLAVIAGFHVVRRRRHFAAQVPLPRGLFPLAAGIVLLGLAVVEDQGARRFGTEWLPRVSGLYELTTGGAVAAAALLGACCVLCALAVLAEAAVQPREPVVAGLGAMASGPPVAGEAVLDEAVFTDETVFTEETVFAGRAGLTGSAPRQAPVAFGPAGSPDRGRLVRTCAYAAEAGLTAGQWLGSFLLLSALIAGVLLYVEEDGFIVASRTLAPWEAACAGCGLAGALLFALVVFARQRREARRVRVPLPRWLTLPATAALLVVIAVAEYWIIASNANGRLATAEVGRPAWEGLYWVVVGAQFAAMLMGAGCLGRWIRVGWRADGRGAPPG
jgi:hypothetical protein